MDARRDVFESVGVIPCIPSPYCVRTCRDKELLMRRFADHSAVTVIPTWRVSEFLRLRPFKGALIAKPRNGRSSQGLLRCTSIDQLTGFTGREDLIVQPVITGPVFAVDCLRDATDGRSVFVAREELIRTPHGAGVTIRFTTDSGLLEMCQHVVDGLALHGCINLEFIRQGDRYLLMDANPRFSAGVGFSQLAGYDMVANHLRCHSGDPIDPSVHVPHGTMATRRQELEVLK